MRADVRLQQANVIVAAPLDGVPVRLAVAAWWNTQQPFQQQLPPSQQQQLSQQQPRRNISTYNAAVVADMAHGRMRRNSITYSTAVWQEVVLLTRLVWVQVLWILQGDKRLQQAVAIVVASLDDAPLCVSVCLCVRGHWLLLQQPQRPQRQQRRGHQPRMHGVPSMFGCRWPHQDWQQWLQLFEHSRQQLLLGGRDVRRALCQGAPVGRRPSQCIASSAARGGVAYSGRQASPGSNPARVVCPLVSGCTFGVAHGKWPMSPVSLQRLSLRWLRQHCWPHRRVCGGRGHVSGITAHRAWLRSPAGSRGGWRGLWLHGGDGTLVLVPFASPIVFTMEEGVPMAAL